MALVPLRAVGVVANDVTPSRVVLCVDLSQAPIVTEGSTPRLGLSARTA